MDSLWVGLAVVIAALSFPPAICYAFVRYKQYTVLSRKKQSRDEQERLSLAEAYQKLDSLGLRLGLANIGLFFLGAIVVQLSGLRLAGGLLFISFVAAVTAAQYFNYREKTEDMRLLLRNLQESES